MVKCILVTCILLMQLIYQLTNLSFSDITFCELASPISDISVHSSLPETKVYMKRYNSIIALHDYFIFAHSPKRLVRHCQEQREESDTPKKYSNKYY